MGVFQRGDNWYIDYRFKGKRYRKKIGKQKKLAEAAYREVMTRIAKGEYLGVYENKRTILKEFANKYLEYARVNLKASSYRRNIVSWNALKEYFGNKYLFEITPEMVEKYKSMRAGKVKPATINREVSFLKAMLNKSVEWEYIKDNPLRSVKKLKEPPGRIKYLTTEEITRLLNAADYQLRPIIVTALNTGMRLSEILNLRWKDIDFKKRLIMVLNTKNNESRFIPINNMLFTELKSLPRHLDNDKVFFNTRNRPFKSFRTVWLKALKRANLTDFRFHDLRHTFASYLAMNGESLLTIAKLLGHKTLAMVQRYAHLSTERLAEAVDRINLTYDNALTSGQESKEKNIP